MSRNSPPPTCKRWIGRRRCSRSEPSERRPSGRPAHRLPAKPGFESCQCARPIPSWNGFGRWHTILPDSPEKVEVGRAGDGKGVSQAQSLGVPNFSVSRRAQPSNRCGASGRPTWYRWRCDGCLREESVARLLLQAPSVFSGFLVSAVVNLHATNLHAR